MKSFAMVLSVSVLALGSSGLWYWHSQSGQTFSFRTANVERGALVATISASGTIEPEEVVDVGTQVAGQIKNLGQDPHNSAKAIDYCSEVAKDTVLAQLDDVLFKARVDQARAAVKEAQSQIEQAQADQRRAEADLQQMQAKHRQAERDWERAEKLGPSRAVSATDYDTMRATYETARANVAVAEAAIAQARAAKEKALATKERNQGTLDEALANLSYTTIRSPVKGVIVDRRVNVGQTVVAGLNAPSLFLIAKDLSRMQVWASVNEADIGNIHPGQPVRFTVDAYPNETFQGEVAQIRLNASMTQNVVIYTVVVNTDNSQRKLLPYLTTNLLFEVGRHDSILLVPNAALRWKPQPEQVLPSEREAYLESKKTRHASGNGQEKKEKGQRDHGTAWVEKNGYVAPVKVKLGLSDGSMTEVLSDGLDESASVVIGEEHSEEGGGTTNPFLPKLHDNRRK